MKFLSNTYDPEREDAPKMVSVLIGESQQEAWHWHKEWLRGKIIGEPQATSVYTVEQLKEMGMVGVYVA